MERRNNPCDYAVNIEEADDVETIVVKNGNLDQEKRLYFAIHPS